MSLAADDRLRMLARMGVDVYVPRAASDGEASRKDSAQACILIRLDRPKSALDQAQKQMLGRILKAMQWNGAFRQDDPQDDRAVLEIAFGVAASGCAESSVETDAVDRLVSDEGRRRALWARLKAELPRLRELQP